MRRPANQTHERSAAIASLSASFSGGSDMHNIDERYALHSRPQQLSLQQQFLQRTRPQTRPKMMMMPNRVRSSSTARLFGERGPHQSAYHQYYHGHFSPAPLQRTVTAPEHDQRHWGELPSPLERVALTNALTNADLSPTKPRGFSRAYQIASQSSTSVASVRAGTPTSSTASHVAASIRSHPLSQSTQQLPRPPSTHSTPYR